MKDDSWGLFQAISICTFLAKLLTPLKLTFKPYLMLGTSFMQRTASMPLHKLWRCLLTTWIIPGLRAVLFVQSLSHLTLEGCIGHISIFDSESARRSVVQLVLYVLTLISKRFGALRC